MKFSTTRENLLSAMSKVTCTPRKTPMPILSQVLVIVEPDGTTLFTGSDIETTQTVHLAGAYATEPGKATFPPKTLTDAIKALAKGSDVSLAWSKENRLTVETMDQQSNINSFALSCETADVYPQLPTISETAQRVELDAAWLIEQLKIASVYASPDKLRPQLTGLNLVAACNRFSITATDGHRIYNAETPITNNEISFSMIMPRVGAEQLVKSLAKIVKDANGCGCVELWETDSCIEWRASHFRHYSRCIDGVYPNIYQCIPDCNITGVLHADRVEMTAALMQARAVANEINHQVRLSLNGSVNLIVEDIEQGREARQTLTTSSYEHADPKRSPESKALSRFLEYIYTIERTNKPKTGRYSTQRHLEEHVLYNGERLRRRDFVEQQAVLGSEATQSQMKGRGRKGKFWFIADTEATQAEVDYLNWLKQPRSESQLDIGFNVNYLLDSLASIPGDSVDIEFRGATTPAIFRSSVAPDRFALVMPVRLN